MTARALHSSSNFARSYYYVCILDQASGWPLVSLIMDASEDEAEALIPLLSDLFCYFDFIGPQTISGDGDWDESGPTAPASSSTASRPFPRDRRRSGREQLPPSSESVPDGRRVCQ